MSKVHRDPWHVWKANNNLPDTSARLRLYHACKTFQQDARTKILENKELWQTFIHHFDGTGQTVEYQQPNPSAFLNPFFRLCEWFLGEACESFIDHTARKALDHNARFAAFEKHRIELFNQAYVHNWQWGLGYLGVTDVGDDVWRELCRRVISWKTGELRALWSERSVPPPAVTKRKRLPSTIESLSAAARMETFLRVHGISQKDFSISVGTTERTLLSFRSTGKIRRDLFEAIAKGMGTTKEELLKLQ